MHLRRDMFLSKITSIESAKKCGYFGVAPARLYDQLAVLVEAGKSAWKRFFLIFIFLFLFSFSFYLRKCIFIEVRFVENQFRLKMQRNVGIYGVSTARLQDQLIALMIVGKSARKPASIVKHEFCIDCMYVPTKKNNNNNK